MNRLAAAPCRIVARLNAASTRVSASAAVAVQTVCRSQAARHFATQSKQVPLSPLLTQSLEQLDPQMHDIIEHEKARQVLRHEARKQIAQQSLLNLALIPSENFTSVSVLQALGSVMSNKYSEGYPDRRYYGGNEFIDQAEKLCQQRALELYKLDSQQWGVNVQALSGSPANFYAYTAILSPHDRIMSLDLPSGGHLSHGYQVANKKISAVSVYFEVLPYHVDSHGLIDYDELERNAKIYRPKLIVTGASAYARHIDYARVRRIADSIGAYLLIDFAHISGLIAGGVMPTPFDHCHIATTTTHKSLRGPRGAMIFYRKGVRSTDKKTGKQVLFDLDERVNAAVFPMHQGGPHNATIAALAVALKQAAQPEFQDYARRVLENNAVLVKYLMQQGYKIVSDGSDNHLLLMDLRPLKINGGKVEKLLDRLNIAINKNTVPGDVSAMNPGGIRLGSPALTSRGLTTKDFEQVGQFIHRGIQMALQLQAKAGSVKLVDFNKQLDEAQASSKEWAQLKQEVQQFARRFPTPGFDESKMKYRI